MTGQQPAAQTFGALRLLLEMPAPSRLGFGYLGGIGFSQSAECTHSEKFVLCKALLGAFLRVWC